MEKEFRKSIKESWRKIESSFPERVNSNSPEYCEIPVTRVVFSENRKILDIEDVAGNNIRIIDKEEAEWLLNALQRYLKGLEETSQ